MLLKKIFFLYLIFLIGTNTTACPMFRQIPTLGCDDSIIKEAVYYKIHDHGGCTIYPVPNKPTSPFQHMNHTLCSAYDLLAHTKDYQVLTYHNKDWEILGIVDVTNLNLPEDKLEAYAKSRLDPESKPKAVRSLIYYDELLGRTISFYDLSGTVILSKGNYYDQFGEESCMQFQEYIDLSEFTDLENLDTDGGCTLF